MTTNLSLTDHLTIYETVATEFGDTPPKDSGHHIAALIEDVAGMAYQPAADINTGEVTAFIAPDEPFYVEREGRLFGLLAQFDRYAQPDDYNWYRITSVHPGVSIYTEESDLVELTMTKIVKKA